MGERRILDDAQRAIVRCLARHEGGLQRVAEEQVFVALQRGGGFGREQLGAAADRLASEGLLTRDDRALKLTRAGYLCGKHDICDLDDGGSSSAFVL